jgi:hypothetical protein
MSEADDAWNAWLDARIERERKLIFDVVARCIAAERQRMREEIAELVRVELAIRLKAGARQHAPARSDGRRVSAGHGPLHR